MILLDELRHLDRILEAQWQTDKKKGRRLCSFGTLPKEARHAASTIGSFSGSLWCRALKQTIVYRTLIAAAATTSFWVGEWTLAVFGGWEWGRELTPLSDTIDTHECFSLFPTLIRLIDHNLTHLFI